MTPAPRIAILARIALLVAAGDFITKDVAVRWLGALDPHMTSAVRFGVVHNDRAAFGLSYGPNTFELNLALTLAAMVLIVPVSRELARIDRHSPVALGLILGGALGNFTSLVLEPLGVVDFIAIATRGGHGLVLNVADVAAYVGLGMLARTGWLLTRELRARGVRPRTALVADAPLTLEPAYAQYQRAREVEREVPRPVHREGIPADIAWAAGERGAGRLARAETAEIIPIDTPRLMRHVHLEIDRGAMMREFPRPMSHPPLAD